MQVKSNQTKEPTWDAEFYYDNSRPQFEAAQRLIRQISFQGNEHILDVGCGDGKISAVLTKKVPKGRVVGIDPSQSMIDFAKKTFPVSKYSSLEFFRLMAEEITFQEEFDLVVSFTALHWSRDIPAVLAGISRALKRKGKFYLTVPASLGSRFYEAVSQTISTERWKRYFDNFIRPVTLLSDTEYSQLLAKQNLQPLSVQTFPLSYRFEDAEELKNWLLGHSSFLTPIPQPLRSHFISDLVAIFMNHQIGRPQPVFYDETRTEIHAEKLEPLHD
ncbi:MAG: methyltransferase domain-containing protein [Deltaproteobacteria bacterium]|nr:methyltransferase domain-containing protein [Deltaproteobacteria bacterium]